MENLSGFLTGVLQRQAAWLDLDSPNSQGIHRIFAQESSADVMFFTLSDVILWMI
jgi:hypothetical protein